MKTTSKVPTEFELSLIREQQELRGSIISAYAQAEYLTLDVALQARLLLEYWRLDLKYHRKLSNRLEQTHRLFEAPGPLNKYLSRVAPLLNELSQYKSDRDFLAHSFCRIHHDGQQPLFIYKMIRIDDGTLNKDTKSFYRLNLQRLSSKLTDLSQRFLLLFKEIYLQEGLETFPFADEPTLP